MQPGRTIYPRLIKNLMLIIISALFVAVAWWMAGSGDPKNIWVGYLTIAVFGGCGLIGLAGILTRRPNLTLSHEGITLKSVFKTQTWRWSETGPFNVDSMKIMFSRNIYVCAFSAHNHNLFSRLHGRAVAGISDADISIIISGLPPGKNLTSAEAFAEELNAWRNKYSSQARPKQITPLEMREALDVLKAKKKKQYWIFGILIGAAVLYLASKVLRALY